MSANDLEAELAHLRARVDEQQRALQMYQLVLDTLPMRIFWKDAAALRYLGCNKSFAGDAGLASSADFIGRDDFAFAWAPQAEAYRADDRLVIDTLAGRVNYEEPQTRPDGSEAWVVTNKIPLVDPDGTVIGVLGTYEDITDRKTVEQKRLAMQEQIIIAQQDSLRELSTPLIPLAAHVVAMPLVGAIDTRRATQIMETLLEGIATLQADYALIDVSGVRVIDTQVADALLRSAHAAKLLGAQVVLTGISSEIAMTLVHLGADLSGIITMATLREGLGYAAAHVGD